MNVKVFKGSPKEIGKQKGAIYKKNGLTLDWGFNNNSEIFKNQFKIYKKYYPEMIEEIEGIAEGAGFEKEEALQKFLTSEIFWYTNSVGIKRACTIFGVQNKNGVFVGRNYDWHPGAEKSWEVYKIKSPEHYSLTAISDMAVAPMYNPKKTFYYADDAINEKGLYIGLTFAFNDKWSFGISNFHTIRLISERCKTVIEALEIFKEIPICCPKNYFIADKNGNMAVLEHTSKRFKILHPKNGILIQTNHYVNPELAKEDTVFMRVPSHNTYLRYYEALQKIALRKSNFQLSDVIKILGLKSYIYQDFSDVKTNWSLALDMKKQKYNLYWNLQEEKKVKILDI